MILSLSPSLNRLKPKHTPEDSSPTIKYNSDQIPRSWNAMGQNWTNQFWPYSLVLGLVVILLRTLGGLRSHPVSVDLNQILDSFPIFFGGDEPVKRIQGKCKPGSRKLRYINHTFSIKEMFAINGAIWFTYMLNRYGLQILAKIDFS